MSVLPFKFSSYSSDKELRWSGCL